MKHIILSGCTGLALCASFPALKALSLVNSPSTSNVVLKPIYVGHGQSIALLNGCSVSVFDAGGSENGFAELRKIYQKLVNNSGQMPKIDVLLVSHIHKDHTAYLPKLVQDKVEINTFISNLSAKRNAAELGILKFSGKPRMIFKGISTNNYQPFTMSANDRLQCTSKKIDLELLWGSLSDNDPKITPLYIRHRENNDSVVSGITGDITPVLFLGDMNISGQKLLLRSAHDQLIKYKGGIVVAGHHGITNGVYENLYRFLRPQKVIVSRNHTKPMVKKDIEAIDRHVRGSQKRETRLVECDFKSAYSAYTLPANSSKLCKALVSPSIIQLSPHRQVEIPL